jgi:hypothetical protein
VQSFHQRPACGLSHGQALLRALAVDGALDREREQRVDAAYDFDGDRRERISFLPVVLRRAFSSMSAMAKNGRGAWTQHAASRIGPGFQSDRYSRL